MKKIVTHNRQFNLDEIAAISLLKKFAPDEYEIIRTRDPKQLEKFKKDPSVFVLDVGTEFDSKKLNFDHHQKSMSKNWDNGVPFSSCGLIWEWLKKQGKLDEFSNNEKMRFESDFIKKVDAQDNGVKIFPEMTFVTKSNRNHSDDKVMDKHFFKTLKQVDMQLEIFTNNVKNGMKKPFVNQSKVTPYLDYLMTTALMKNYYFVEEFEMKTENGVLGFAYKDKHGDLKEMKYFLNEKSFESVDGDKTKIDTTLTEHAWSLITNSHTVSHKMNDETIKMVKSKVINHFKKDGHLPIEMSHLFMLEHAGTSQKEGFKTMNAFLGNTYSEIRSELRNDKEIKKFIRKSADLNNFVLCEKNIRGAGDKIKTLAPDTLLMVVPRDKKSWKIQTVGNKGIGMPKEWRGLNESKLRKVAKDNRLIFCHKAGFMLMIECSKEEVVKFTNSLLEMPDLKVKRQNRNRFRR